MSLYNLINGENKIASLLLLMLNLIREDVPRYRDCYWTGEYIAIYTRTGGGNRAFYESEQSCRENYPEYFRGEDYPKGPWNENLRKIEGYMRDEDDDFDSTYATFFYKVPEQFMEVVKDLKTDKAPHDKFIEFMDKMMSPDAEKDPEVQRVMKAMKPLMDKIKDDLNNR